MIYRGFAGKTGKGEAPVAPWQCAAPTKGTGTERSMRNWESEAKSPEGRPKKEAAGAGPGRFRAH